MKGRGYRGARIRALAGRRDKKTQDEIKLWHQTLRAFRAQQWDQVEVNLINLQRMNPGSELYRLYADDVAKYRRNPPPAGWEGVRVFDEK